MNRLNCIELLRKTGCNDDVIEHSIAVAELALEIWDREFREIADRDLIEAGALLHDIGRSQTHGIDHAVAGSMIAKGLGLDPRLVLIIERHIGAGITRDEAKELGLPPKAYIPETIEEKIVAHADNLVDDTTRITFDERIQRVGERLTESHVNRMVKLHEEVCGSEQLIGIFWGFAKVTDVKHLMGGISTIEQDNDIVIQIVDAGLIAGDEHIRSAVKKAVRSMNAGEGITSNPGLEILLYLAGTRHIKKALEIGVKEGIDRVCVIITGVEIKNSVKDKVFDLLSFESADLVSSNGNKQRRLMEFFEIAEEEILSVDENKLEKLVIERGALLEVAK